SAINHIASWYGVVVVEKDSAFVQEGQVGEVGRRDSVARDPDRLGIGNLDGPVVEAAAKSFEMVWQPQGIVACKGHQDAASARGRSVSSGVSNMWRLREIEPREARIGVTGDYFRRPWHRAIA